MDREYFERFPYFDLRGDTNGNYRIELSSGQCLHLGRVHRAAVMDLLGLVKTINKLADNPASVSYDELKDRYGEYEDC